jgi:hypothetical protein
MKNFSPADIHYKENMAYFSLIIPPLWFDLKTSTSLFIDIAVIK